jgi:lipopolysaccharide transport system permease protein
VNPTLDIPAQHDAAPAVGDAPRDPATAAPAAPQNPAVATSATSAAASSEIPEISRTIIRPASGWQLVNISELWRYRELLYFLTWRDVKVRYKQTALGAAWAILQPVMMMIVFTVFFGRLAKVPAGNVPYPLFVFAGLLPWTFFSTAIANAGNSVVGSERLITKIYFPRLAIPLAAVGAALVDFAIAFAVMIVLMLWYHVMPGPRMLVVPALVLLLTCAAVGVGTLLAALNVAYRDFRYVIPFLVQLWMFATPSVYMSAGAGTSTLTHWLLILNPMTGVISAFRAATLGTPIAWGQLALCTAIIAAACAAGCLYFRKVEDSFADVI